MPPFDLDIKPKKKKYNPVIGDYGQRKIERGPAPLDYELPDWADPAYLNTISEQELKGILTGLDNKRREADQSRRGQQVNPIGYDVGDEGSGPILGGDDLVRQQSEDNYDRLLGQIRSMVTEPYSRFEYDRSRQPAFLAGELGAAGYEFMPGFLADAANRQALYESRDNLLGFANRNKDNVAKGGFGNAYQMQNRGLWSGADDPFGVRAKYNGGGFGYGGQPMPFDDGTGVELGANQEVDQGVDLTPASGFRTRSESDRYSKPSRTLPGFSTGNMFPDDFGGRAGPSTDMRSLGMSGRRQRYQPRWV